MNDSPAALLAPRRHAPNPQLDAARTRRHDHTICTAVAANLFSTVRIRQQRTLRNVLVRVAEPSVKVGVMQALRAGFWHAS
jgi:hypothetical protein